MSNPLMKFFKHDHLPTHLRSASGPCCDLATFMDQNLPESAEKTAGLRKLLEAKDCFVRAALTLHESNLQPKEESK